jgi:nucleoside-diphosphate-sugar epimerase
MPLGLYRAPGQGFALAAVRADLVVGTPREDGPADPALMKHFRGRVPIPGDGRQRVWPVMIDDLAKTVGEASVADAPPEEVLVRPPKPLTVNELVGHVSGARPVPIPRLAHPRRSRPS